MYVLFKKKHGCGVPQIMEANIGRAYPREFILEVP
jgi:hypothetical protein